jgi:hypothetical protein
LHRIEVTGTTPIGFAFGRSTITGYQIGGAYTSCGQLNRQGVISEAQYEEIYNGFEAELENSPYTEDNFPSDPFC